MIQISFCWKSLKYTIFSTSNRNTITDIVDLRCYTLWVGIECASRAISLMFLVLVTLFAVWLVTIIIMNTVVGKKCGWVFAPIHTRVTLEYCKLLAAWALYCLIIN